MAYVRFLNPFNKITQKEYINIDVKNLREMAEELIKIYGKEMDVILDNKGNLSSRIVVLVNRRNAHTIKGAETVLYKDSEVIIMPYIYGG